MNGTEWYTGDQKPVHIGVYKRYIENEGFRYSMWNGAAWLDWCGTVSSAYKQRGKSRTQNAPWRGLQTKDGK
jgi:hypothetical protein